MEFGLLSDLFAHRSGLQLFVIVQKLQDDGVGDLLAPEPLADVDDANPSVFLP